MDDMVDWRGLSQDQLDAGLNNSLAVSNSSELVAGWADRSALRESKEVKVHLDLRYGDRERNRIDFIESQYSYRSLYSNDATTSDNKPTLVFIHGGYWQMRSKESFTTFASGPLAHGINVALIGYTLAPEATLDEIVSEVHSGLDFLVSPSRGLIAPEAPIIVAGWSAGGHLTAMSLSHTRVKAGLSISGVFDLEPIRHSYLNVKLNLDEAAAKLNSPILHLDKVRKPMSLVVGGEELPLLRQQTAKFAAARVMNGLPVTYEEIKGANHFTIMDELESPNGRITTLVRQLIDR